MPNSVNPDQTQRSMAFDDWSTLFPHGVCPTRALTVIMDLAVGQCDDDAQCYANSCY